MVLLVPPLVPLLLLVPFLVLVVVPVAVCGSYRHRRMFVRCRCVVFHLLLHSSSVVRRGGETCHLLQAFLLELTV